MHPSKVLLACLVMLSLLAFGLDYWDVLSPLHYVFIPLGILAGAVWVLSSDVDYTISRLRGLRLPSGDENYLSKKWYLYGLIDKDEWIPFSRRVRLLYLGNAYMQVTDESTPPHGLRLITAATAAFVELKLAKGKLFDNVVYSYHSGDIVSPVFPYPHAEEWFEADRSFLFNAAHIAKSQNVPKAYLDILLYTHMYAQRREEGGSVGALSSVSVFLDQLKKPASDISLPSVIKCMELADGTGSGHEQNRTFGIR